MERTERSGVYVWGTIGGMGSFGIYAPIPVYGKSTCYGKGVDSSDSVFISSIDH